MSDQGKQHEYSHLWKFAYLMQGCENVCFHNLTWKISTHQNSSVFNLSALQKNWVSAGNSPWLSKSGHLVSPTLGPINSAFPPAHTLVAFIYFGAWKTFHFLYGYHRMFSLFMECAFLSLYSWSFFILCKWTLIFSSSHASLISVQGPILFIFHENLLDSTILTASFHKPLNL